MIEITNSGNFEKTRAFIDRLLKGDIYGSLDRHGRLGVDSLSRATPVDSGLTATSWGYRIIKDRSHPGIEWYNTNSVDGTSVAILIQYGHATGTGGFVAGRDFINPAILPIFDQIAIDVWREVTS